MKPIEEVLAQPTGARFFRADLHIHCLAASHDVKDPTMTGDAVVATAVQENIAIIAITDHNEIDNVEPAIQASNGSGVFVVPGIELSTHQGHLLCYLPTLDALRRFRGQLSIVDRDLQTSRCQQSILDCLNLLSGLNGFGVLAHVDIPSGFEVQVPGASPHKRDVLCHPSLLGIELKHATSPISYADSDPDPERARLGQERIDCLKLGLKQNLARVLNSDSHTLETLGRNALNAQRVTRYKMDAPSFEGLRIAFEDADARVRIEDDIPQTIPRILGVHLDGGFLSGQVVQFSPNLNCIIGGRGTGKSTAFEGVRCLAKDHSSSDVIDSEVWPELLHLFWEDQAGQRHTLFRLKDNDVGNLDDPDLGPCSFDVDCFGQGEAARISFEAKSNPLALLKYLDRFVDLEEAISQETSAREQLRSLEAEIQKGEQQVQLIPQYVRMLATTKQQLGALQKPEVKELIALHRELAVERELRGQILAKMQEAKNDLGRRSPKAVILEIRALADPSHVKVGALEFQTILNGATSFETIVGSAESEIKLGLATFDKIVSAQILRWKTKDSEAQQKIDIKRRELEALKVSFDMSYIGKLAAEEARQQQALINLNKWKLYLAETRKNRENVLKDRWAARDRIATLRDAFGRRATKTLKEALTDLQVSLKYVRNAYSPEATDLIIDVMGWKTNQQPRANFLVETITIPVLLDALRRRDPTPILKLKTAEGVDVFKRDDADAVVERLSKDSVRFALERVTLHDLPRLQVSRVVQVMGKTRHVTREFAKLSLGQQQSVLLALMLSSDTDKPLIIDQPEDNLDGEFIYSTLVPVLRRAKERRQIIVITHNANVAVLGDAELIIVMKAMNDRGEIFARGSIDDAEIRSAACSILEGSRQAFLRRAKMYGIHFNLGGQGID